MARNVINEKGFKIIGLSPDECQDVGFGYQYIDNVEDYKWCWDLICDNCNKEITDDDEVYYVSVLNRVFDKECLINWYLSAKHYPEDDEYEALKYDTVSNHIKIADDDVDITNL